MRKENMKINIAVLASKITNELLKSDIYFLPKSYEYTHNEIKLVLNKIIKRTIKKEIGGEKTKK